MATPAILQAVMQIIDRQEYISWKLPKYTSCVLSTNPDDGSYNVSSEDAAQKSRYINFKVKFDINAWAEWAESVGLDSRAINFLLQYHRELMDDSKTGEAKVNARNYTMFANTISGIPDWSKTESLAFILQIASGCFLDDDDVVGSLFTTFINNKLDKLMTPEDMVHKDWTYVKSKLLEQLYDGDQYRADIASILTTRFVNYSMLWFGKAGNKSEVITNRIIEIVENDKMLLSEDLIFSMCKTLVKNYPVQSNKLLLNKTLIKKII